MRDLFAMNTTFADENPEAKVGLQLEKDKKKTGSLVVKNAFVKRERGSSIGSISQLNVSEEIVPVPLSRHATDTYSLPTFLEYISGGCELHLCVAIDFTASNGELRQITFSCRLSYHNDFMTK